MRLNKLIYKYKTFLMVLIVLITSQFPQTFKKTSYSIEEGLPSSYIYYTTQDNNGKMWFATRNGITSYDGVKWKYFFRNIKDKDTEFHFIKKDEKGYLWAIGRTRTISIKKYDGFVWSEVSKEQNNPEFPGFFNSIEICYENDNPVIFIATEVGILQFKNNIWKKLTIAEGLASNHIYVLKKIDNKLFVVTSKNIQVYQNNVFSDFLTLSGNENEEFVDITAHSLGKDEYWVLLNKSIRKYHNDILTLEKKIQFKSNSYYRTQFAFDFKNYLIYISDGSLNLYNTKSKEITILNSKNGLLDRSATSFFIDREKNIWISGVIGVDKISSLMFSNYSSRHGLYRDEVTSITEGYSGDILTGHKGGFTVLTPRFINNIDINNRLKTTLSSDKIKIFNFCRDENGIIWASAQNQGILKIDKNYSFKQYKVNANQINYISIDKSNNLYALSPKRLFKFNKSGDFFKETLQFPDDIIAKKIYFSPNNDLYITTDNSGLVIIRNDSIYKILKVDPLNKKNIKNDLYAILFNYKNKILVGGFSGIYELTNNSFIPFEDGFKINNPVYFMNISKKGDLWIGTDLGVMKWNGKKLVHFTKKQGLAGLETYRDGFFEDKYGNIWICTEQGLSKYSEDFDEEYEKPRVKIESVITDKTIYYLNNQLHLKSNENSIQFEFYIDSFKDEKSNKFIYYLEGYEENWSPLYTFGSNSIRYNNLDPGKYKIHIKSLDAFGYWGEEAVSPVIIIDKPFYKSAWFLILSVVGFGFIIFSISRVYHKLKYTHNLEIEISKRTKELSAAELKYKQIFLENQAAMLIVDPLSYKIIDANKAALNLYGYSLTQLLHLNYENLDNLFHIGSLITKISKDPGNNKYFTSQHKMSDGSFKEVELYVSLIHEEGKNILYIIIHDINSKVLVEKAYAQSEERYLILINNMQDGIVVFKDMNIIFLNKAFALMVGASVESLQYRLPRKILYKDDFTVIKDKIQNLYKGEKTSEEFELRFIHEISRNIIFTYVSLSIINYNESFAILASIKNITTKKKQEDLLRKLSVAIEQSPTAIIITDTQGNIEYINPRFTEMTGYSFHEAFRRNINMIKSGLMDKEIYRVLWNTINDGFVWRGELQNIRKNGEIFWVFASISPLKNEHGKITHFIATEEDITFDKYAIEQIKEQKEKLTSLLENLPIIIFSLDKNEKITLVKGFQFSLDEEKYLTKDAKVIFNNSPDILGDLQNLKQGISVHTIRRVKDFYFEVIYNPVIGPDGTYEGTNGFAYDVTSRQIALDALRENEERFRTLFENSSIGIYRTTPEGKVLLANPKMMELLDYTSFEELQNANIYDENFGVKINRNDFMTKIQSNGYVGGLESFWIKNSGQFIYVRESAKAIKNSDGEILYYDGVIEDITEKKIAEQDLIRSEAKNKAMLNAIPDIIIEINSSGYILNIHKSEDKSSDLFDLSEGKTIEQIFDNEIALQFANSIINALEIRGIQIFEFTKTKGEEVIYFETRIIPSGINSLIIIIRNVTSAKLHEKALIKAKEEAEKSDRLQSEFLAQMSHEIRTPINSILSFTSLLKSEVEHIVPDDLKISFDAIDNGGRRLIQTIDSILNMSLLKTGTYNPVYKNLDLDKDIINPVVKELKTRARQKNLKLNYFVNTDSGIITGDSYTLGQIFVNLIDNAIKYTAEGEVSVELFKNDEGLVCVSIKDTGIGISEEYFPNLFKPFTQEETGYTRKFEGNGLGLALVKNYVVINKAEILVSSTKGIGTEFKIIFS